MIARYAPLRVAFVGMASLVSLAAHPAAVASPASTAELSRQLEACRAILQDRRRLECFDAIDPGSRAAQSPAAVTDSRDAQAERFGDEFLRRERADDRAVVESISAVLKRVETRPRGEYVFYLDNGQVWTELEKGRARYRQGMAVDIERTPLGAYMLSTESGGRATRVKRLE